MGIKSNWCGCTKCHAGYGWKDSSYDFSNMENVDCLVCHDTTGKYSKKKNSCGYPDKGLDLTEIAKQVGPPGLKNCGTCHWYGGGGDNVKHGDLASDLLDYDPALDVHMGGEEFTCQECHTTEAHRIAGRSTTSSVSEGVVSCTDCHDENPHDNSAPLLKKLNEHGTAISCQTCHIPMYAKNKHTLTYRDGSQTSKKKKILKKSENRIEIKTPLGIKILEKNLRPFYAWYNGKHNRYLPGDQVNLNGVTPLNAPDGSIADPLAKITPYKIMKSHQATDAKYGYLIIPHLIGKDGMLATQDWNKTAQKGMDAAGLKFSGKITFTDVMMYWRLNHGVVPKKDALSCLDCHSPDGVMNFKALGYKGDPAKVGRRLN